MKKVHKAEVRQKAKIEAINNSFVEFLLRQAAKCEDAGRHHQDNQGCCHVCGIVLDESTAVENGIHVE